MLPRKKRGWTVNTAHYHTANAGLRVDNRNIMTVTCSLSPLVQCVKEGDTQTVGLQWRSENLFQGLAFPEQELDVGGAYIWLLTLGSASMMSKAQVSRRRNWRWGDSKNRIGEGSSPT